MNKVWAIQALVAGSIVATGCTSGPAPVGGDSASDTQIVDDDAISIPEPGEYSSQDRWYDDGAYHGTPDKAQAMGVVLSNPSYIQGGIDPETGNHFFVFKMGPEQTDFSVNLRNQSSEIDHVHIHDGTGLVFGEEVPASEVYSATRAEWELESDTIYVLEVHSPEGGFF
jgi:hypothetical protein